MSAYKRKDAWGDKWHYSKRVKLPDGRSVRLKGTPAINTKRAAEDAERAHVELALNPPKVAIERRKMTDVFDRFVSDYVTIANNKASEKTSKTGAIDRYLKPDLGHLYIDEVSASHIAEMTAKLHRTAKGRGEGTLGAKTVKNILQTLRKCLRWAVEMEWIEKVPALKMPKVDDVDIRFLEDAELVALVDAASAEPIWYAAIVLAADAGLRRGELRALRWADLNEVANKLVIARSRWRNIETSPKSRKPRTVPLTKRLGAALKAIRGTKLRGPYVLSRADGGPFGAEFLYETIERLTRKAKLSECGWHTLRHTFITRLAMKGVPPKTIQELAGHASIATTMRYMHVVQGAADSAIAMLDDERPRVGPGNRSSVELGAEGGEVVPFYLVTPSGLEPEFST